MKKILLLWGIIFFLGIGTVKAEEVTLREVNAYKGYATKIVGSNSYYGPIHYLYFGNTVAYCLEGSVMITNSNYQKEPFGTYFEENLRKELELISYYGYEYKDHKRLEYYMATQELIWLRLGIDRVIWSTEPLGKGTIFNIEDYKEEIESLVAQHNDMPSFITPTFMKEGWDYSLNFDPYNINDYTIDALHSELTLNGNDVLIVAREAGKEKIHIAKKMYKEKESYVYKSPGSQTIGSFGMSSPVDSFMEYDISSAKVPVTLTTTAYFIKKDFTYEKRVTDKFNYHLTAQEPIYSYDGTLLYKTEELIDTVSSLAEMSLFPGKYCLSMQESQLFQGMQQCFEVLETKVSLNIQLKNALRTIHGSVLKEEFFTGNYEKGGWANQSFEVILDKDQKIDDIFFLKGTKVTEFLTDENGDFSYTIPKISYRILKKRETLDYNRTENLIYTEDDINPILFYQLNKYQLTVENKIENGNVLTDGNYSIYNEVGDLLATNSFQEKDILLPKGNYVVRLDYTEEGYSPFENRIEIELNENKSITFFNYSLEMPDTNAGTSFNYLFGLLGLLFYAIFKK